ncbi:KAP family P-loop NTPase fold protein [Caulobacter radicis]|uniref:KAP family P-loop NTPase fold protein n=1 Tax=Caulobacter radicis TaxID=2172650 RepID=UPI0014027B36|nr:P-loop NTPase fold protein [Caulobacter radicis]
MVEKDRVEAPETFKFADDAPRHDPWSEDDFGYRPFAKRLADVLWQLSAPNGYVIGLHGAWGSGKTTALNFIAHFLGAKNREDTKRAVEIVRFSPWMFSGQQDLISAFFRVLAEALKDGGETVRKVRTAARTTAKAAVDPTVRAAVTLAVTAHPPEAAAIRAGGALAKSAMEQTIDAWLGEPTLQAAYQDLVKRLRKSGRRFVVFIDDIDRLEPSEVRSIMQMVKSVGQLPNVVYVLAYDRRIVWRALGEREQQKGGEPTFTEKIIQHELELPHAQRSALLRRVDRELAFVLSNVQSSTRWLEIIQHGFHRWIQSPRDIVRLSNALRFTWPPLAAEVDAADVVAMEALRLFDPVAFDWVRANRDFLIDGGAYRSDTEKKTYAATFRQSLDPAHRDDIVELLSALFPSKSKILRVDDRFSFGEIWAETVNRRGIGSHKGYDAYFSLFPSDHVIPKSLVDAAAAAPDDESVQTAALATAIAMVDEQKHTLVGDYIDELSYRQAPRNGMRPGKAMLKAFIKQAAFIQNLNERAGGLFGPGPGMHLLLRQILVAWDAKTAGAALLEAVGHDAPAEVLATLWVWRARESGVLPAEGAQVGDVIDKASLRELGRRALAAILAEQDRALVNAPYYWDIMHTWSKLGVASEAKAWLAGVAKADPHNLAKIARGVLARSMDGGRNQWFFRGLGDDISFYDPEALLAACETAAEAQGLDEDETDRIIALRDGLRAARKAELARAKAARQVKRVAARKAKSGHD